MAAVLICGDDAMLTHRSAAELWGFGCEADKRLDVTIRRRSVVTREADKLGLVDLEALFRPIERAAALPSPLSKRWVLGYEVDFYFPSLGLIVETDASATAAPRPSRRGW